MFFMSKKVPEVSIDGLLGGEKIGLYENTVFKEGIKKEKGLTMNYHKAGSYDMVKEDSSKYDYLFPSSQLALELFQKNGGKYKKQDIVFNTPIVLYTRKAVADVLAKEGILTDEGDIHYVDMTKLAKMVADGVKWKDIGLTQLYGQVLVDTTDPNKSNSGNMFLGLLANSLNNGEVVTKANIQDIKPKIKQIYQKIGHMQSSSSDMFNQFLKQGIGSFPIIAGYENQILELSKLQPDIYSQIKDDLVIMYPSPTVWSSHVFIALTEAGEKGLEALMTPKVQEIAWKEHGFRTIVSGTANPDEFKVSEIPDQITRVMPMPDIDVMLDLMKIIMED